VIRCEGLAIDFRSPSAGRICFSRKEPLRVEEEVMPLTKYPQFENPYCRADFPVNRLLIRHGDEKIEIDFSDENF